MDKIEKPDTRPVGERAMEKMSEGKKKVAKQLVNYSSMIVGIFLILVVIAVFTTDINFMSAADWAKLGLTFFVLLFCSYSMYVNYSDSGTRAGRNSAVFTEQKGKHDTIKKRVIDDKKQVRLLEFCRYYIAEELKNTRDIILANEGLKYEDYQSKWVGKCEEELLSDKTLTKMQVKAIVKANGIKPIKLTPDMILKRGRGGGKRNPLGIKPESKKLFYYISKFITTVVTSIFTGIIVFDVIAQPSWSTIVACLLKLLPIVLNGFMGYKMGYENIAVDTVNYMADQIDLLEQFLQYTDNHPEPVPEYAMRGAAPVPADGGEATTNTENN